MYDITIIGAGVSGIFAAHTLMESGQSLRVLMIDKGKSLHERSCPLTRDEECDCSGCSTYYGFGGLGKSEGKYNFTTDFGGELEDLVGSDRTAELLAETDRVLCMYGGDEAQPYRTHSARLAERAAASGLRLLTSTVRHLGTRLSVKVLDGLFQALSASTDFRFETEVAALTKQDSGFDILLSNGEMVRSHKVILATGRSGSAWLAEICRPLGIEPSLTRLDLGIRLEMPGGQLDSILGETFETKLRYTEEDFSATTYCMNPQGRIVRKFQEGLVMADGQNYREQDMGSPNLNFTLFVPRMFDSLEDANLYAREVLGAINRGGDRIAVQRLRDLKQNLETSRESLAANRVQPSLEADPGNLLNEVPELYIRSTLSFLDALERLIGGPVDEDTLLYAMDSKFYSPRLQTDSSFQTKVSGLYAAGDCSGVTHSLSQAAASGIYTALSLLEQDSSFH